jgi:hypothetical protein
LIKGKVGIALNNLSLGWWREDCLKSLPGLAYSTQKLVEIINTITKVGMLEFTKLESSSRNELRGFRNSSNSSMVLEIVHESLIGNQIKVVKEGLEISRGHLMGDLDNMFLWWGEETSKRAVWTSEDKEIRSQGEWVVHDNYVNIKLILVISVCHEAHVVGIAWSIDWEHSSEHGPDTNLGELDLFKIALNCWFHVIVDVDLAGDVFSIVVEEGALHLLDVLDLGVLHEGGEA